MRDRVELLAGSAKLSEQTWKVFDGRVLAFLERLQSEIRDSGECRAHQEIKAFGFWCRKGNIREMYRRMQVEGDMCLMGRGRVFHVAPSNVPGMFGYSLVLGLLAGNTNQVRLSMRAGEADLLLCRLIEKVLAVQEHHEIRERISLIRYERDTELTEDLINDSDACMFWGGDETVNRMRHLIHNPRLVELSFPDRFGICVLNAEKMADYSDEDVERIAHRFYNDTYVMDQNACSSPQTVVWLAQSGNSQSAEWARQRFWKALYQESLVYPLGEDKVCKKYGLLAEQMMKHPEIARVERFGNRLYVAQLNKIPDRLETFRGKFGLFYECTVGSLTEIVVAISPRLQTITCDGVKREEFDGLLKCGSARGLARIVPVGEALQMDMIWDGKNIIRELSRAIAIPY